MFKPSATKHTDVFNSGTTFLPQPVTLPMFQQSNRQGEPVYSCHAKTNVTHPVRNTLMQQPPMQPLL